jgi:hypothetical protein
MVDITAAAGAQFNFVVAQQLYKRFSLQDIANHRAAVLNPYAALSDGVTEVTCLACPCLC